MTTRALPAGGPAEAEAARRPLRILYHHRIAAADGMRVHLDEVVEALRERGHLVEVVGPGSGGPASGDAKGGGERLERLADRLRAALPPSVFELLEVAYNLPAYLRLSRAARAFKPDVIYERYNLFLLAGLAYAKLHRLPYLLEVNSPLAAERAAFGGMRFTGLANRFETTLWRGADAALPVTGVLARDVERKRRTGQGLQVAPNGFNFARRPSPAAVAAARARIGAPDGALVLGFVGFVRPWHRVDWAIAALSDLPAAVHLAVVGDGPARPGLETLAAARGVTERVHFIGRVPHREAAAYAQAFDVALQTAAVAYASPLKLFEYMALGRAIVAPDQPNIREVLTHGQDALLFAPDDEAAFRGALQALCADATLRARLGAGAARTLRQAPYTWAHNAARIEAISRALLSAPAGAARRAYAANPA